MNIVSMFFARHKPTIYAALGVLALTSTVSLMAGAYNIGKQRQELATLAATNKKWADAWGKMSQVREMEQRNAADLQAKIDAISQGARDDSDRLKELERSNEEVRNILNTRLPDDLRRLLNER